MAVVDGQSVNASVTNAAFVSRTANSSTVGQLALLRPSGSGDTITDVQNALNTIFTFAGMENQSDSTPAYTSTDIVTNGESLLSAISALDAAISSVSSTATSALSSVEGIVDGSQALDQINLVAFTNSTSTGTNAELPIPSGSILYLSNASLSSIAGITATTSNRWLILCNKTGGPVSLVDDGTVTTSEKIVTGTGADLNLDDEASLFLFYDVSDSLWRVVANTSVGGGGGGSSSMTITSRTSNYTAVIGDFVLASGSAFTVTLPTAVGVSGQDVWVKKTDTSLTNIITIDGNGSQTIDGSLTTALHTQGEMVKLTSDGSNWQISDRRIPSIWQDMGAMTVTATTTNPTKGTMVRDKVYMRRVGPSAEITYQFEMSASSSAGTGDYLYALPSGLTINTTIHPIYTGANNSISMGSSGISTTRGEGYTPAGPTGITIGNAICYSSTQFRINWANKFTSTNFQASGFGGWGAALGYAFTVIVPISGWNG